MTKRSLLILFTSINIVFIGAQLYKHARVTRLNYQHSTLTVEVQTLDHTIESIRQKICAHKDTAHIKQYAQDILHMKPVALSKAKRINL